MKCIILAGGSGDSLWPLSRKNYPKQFISNNQSLSVFQETITRNIPFCDEFIIVTNQKYETIVAGQMQQFQGINYRIFLEEVGVGTAGAVALVTQVFDDEEELLVLPSDMVLGQEGYSDAVYRAKEFSADGKIVIWGAVPSSASTDYGYIQRRGSDVTRFIEKPSVELADKLFWRDDILWNCGVLVSKVSVLKAEMLKYCATILKNAETAFRNISQTESGNLLVHGDESVVRTSFDKCILEQCENVAVVRIHCTWSDLSDFSAYEGMYEVNDSNVIKNNCKDTSVINRTESQLVVANGLEDMLVVNTADAVYISDKKNANDIKQIMDDHYSDKKVFFNDSPLVYRPWGTRELIQSGNGYRVRKLVIYPGMKLSNHTHKNRSENYTVVSGVLTIELENEAIELGRNDSYNILPGRSHRLKNNTDDIISVIEVDTGVLIDEADMIHDLSDDEGACNNVLPNLFKLAPAFKDYLWGGNTLVESYGKNSPYDITAESWELSAHPDGSSVIVDGPLDGMTFEHFIQMHGDKVCGWKSKTFDRFPILIKFIDARNALSVQIHPDDDYAFANENEFGKNEMWYVMDCKPGSFLYCGLSREVSKEEIRERIENETLTEVLNQIDVKPGDVVFVPAGTIHAIGAGILICEIQQNSNCTYRMFDYGRRDKNGNLRELHIDKAMDVVNVEPYLPDTTGFGDDVVGENSTQRVLSRCKYFQVTDYKIPEHEIIQVDDSSFKSIVVLSGTCKIRCGEESFEAKAGDSFFVSAGRKRVHVEGNCEIVVTNI